MHFLHKYLQKSIPSEVSIFSWNFHPSSTTCIHSCIQQTYKFLVMTPCFKRKLLNIQSFSVLLSFFCNMIFSQVKKIMFLLLYLFFLKNVHVFWLKVSFVGCWIVLFWVSSPRCKKALNFVTAVFNLNPKKFFTTYLKFMLSTIKYERLTLS